MDKVFNFKTNIYMLTKTNVFCSSVWLVMIRPVLVRIGDNIKSPVVKSFKTIFKPALDNINFIKREELINKLKEKQKDLHIKYIKNQEKAVDNWRENFLSNR